MNSCSPRGKAELLYDYYRRKSPRLCPSVRSHFAVLTRIALPPRHPRLHTYDQMPYADAAYRRDLLFAAVIVTRGFLEIRKINPIG